MRKRLIVGAVIVAFTISMQAETLTCKAARQYKEGGGEEDELTLKIEKGRVTRVIFSNVMSNGQEGGAYFCDLDIGEKSPGWEWERSGKKTRVTNTKSAIDSYAEIELLPDGRIAAHLGTLSPMDHCGFGSEFPDVVILKRGSRKCAVRH